MSEMPEDQAVATGTDPAVDTSGGAHESEDYHGYSVDDEDQPQDTGDSLVGDRGLAEPLDEGYSPPEKWSAGMGYGNTPLEEELGESLDQRVAQEVPERDPYAEVAAQEDAQEDPRARATDEPGLDVDGLDENAPDEGDEVGDARAGRLVEPDEGVRDDTEADAVAEDVGIDGAGAGAEEAAVHVIDDDEV